MNFRGWLKSERVLIRLAALWAICALVFTVAWTASYYLLPEGVLRGRLPGMHIPIETPEVMTTFLRIFLVNLVTGCGIVAFGNLFRVGDTPLGYVVPLIHSALYAALLGTNSFGYPAPTRFAPSLTTVLARSGAFEITAYVAIAAATTGLAILRQRSWLDTHGEQVGSWRKWRLSRAEAAVVVGAILLLAAANYREAVQLHALLP